MHTSKMWPSSSLSLQAYKTLPLLLSKKKKLSDPLQKTRAKDFFCLLAWSKHTPNECSSVLRFLSLLHDLGVALQKNPLM